MPQEKPDWRKAALEIHVYGDAALDLDFAETLLVRYDAKELERILSGWENWVANEPLGPAIQSGEAKMESLEWAWGEDGKRAKWSELGKETPAVLIHLRRDGTFMLAADVLSESGTGQFFTDDLTAEALLGQSSKCPAPRRSGEMGR